jgi:hypothetical protein
VRRGQAGQELLANSLFNEALNALNHDLQQQLRRVALDDIAGHTRLVIALQIAGAVEKFLRNVIADGEAAVEQIRLRGKRID